MFSGGAFARFGTSVCDFQVPSGNQSTRSSSVSEKRTPIVLRIRLLRYVLPACRGACLPTPTSISRRLLPNQRLGVACLRSTLSLSCQLLPRPRRQANVREPSEHTGRLCLFAEVVHRTSAIFGKHSYGRLSSSASSQEPPHPNK